MSLNNKYVSEGGYEELIFVYQEAFDMDPQAEEEYIAH
ncbi:hypothetical protein HNQ41_003273 [Texcoconibacillus texcoconensis]|uniref:Tetratricopeptide repeat protein n=1 Tax=Texcoconibacillus texcoconensis TaxID=1095777 RepID=A0A840QUX1_9BACI|nr:hypothetical protein [Texcoconibacillus texcoconensis]